jgi:hypothetical protein
VASRIIWRQTDEPAGNQPLKAVSFVQNREIENLSCQKFFLGAHQQATRSGTWDGRPNVRATPVYLPFFFSFIIWQLLTHFCMQKFNEVG